MALTEKGLTIPEIMLIGGTRVALGVGLGLLISDRLTRMLIQVSFNVANLIVSATVAYRAYHLLAELVPNGEAFILLPLAASLYFATNTLLVSGILGIIEQKPIFTMWQTWFLWSFPYYLVGSAMPFGWLVQIAMWTGKCLCSCCR